MSHKHTDTHSHTHICHTYTHLSHIHTPLQTHTPVKHTQAYTRPDIYHHRNTHNCHTEACSLTHTHTYTQTHAHIHTHKYTHIPIHTHAHITHTNMHTHPDSHAHIHIHTHSHTHTQNQTYPHILLMASLCCVFPTGPNIKCHQSLSCYLLFSVKREDSVSETPWPPPHMLLRSSPALGSRAIPAWAHRAVLAVFLVWY